MRAKNILQLGIKELWSLARDPGMLVLIAYAFSLSIYAVATAGYAAQCLHRDRG